MIQQHHRKAAKDLALYLLISAAVLLPPVLAAAYGWHPYMVLKTVFAGLYTGVIFGPLLQKTRSHWRKPRFWFGMVALLALHCGVLVYLAKQQHITVWLLVPIGAIEVTALNLWATKFASRRPPLWKG